MTGIQVSAAAMLLAVLMGCGGGSSSPSLVGTPPSDGNTSTPDNSTADADNDGVADADDSCANTPANEVVDAAGCTVVETDGDNDGVADSVDLCPDTTAGASVTSEGCDVALCQQAASEALGQCFTAVAARTAVCYEGGVPCASDDADISAALLALENGYAEHCVSDLTVQSAGFGVQVSDGAVLAQLQEACLGEPATLVARSYGGPQAKLLVNANPAVDQCVTTAYSEAATLIAADYADYAACILDDSCSGVTANQQRDTQTELTIAANCSSPNMSEVQGTAPALFVQRAKLQAQCMVAIGHGDTSNVALNCGPNNQLLDGITIRSIDFEPTDLTIDTLPRAEPVQIILDSDEWGTRCGDGSDYAFQLRLAPEGSSVDKVITHQEGGGVCLAGTGDCVNRPQQLFNAQDNGRRELEVGYLSRRDDNPFRDWTVLHQPYCNQDLHIGGGGEEAGGRPENGGTLYRYGAINVRASMQFFRDLIWRLRRNGTIDGAETGYLPSQPKLLFSGTSAGGYGVQYNLHYPLDELRWENTLGNPHVAFLMGGGTTDLNLLFATVGNTWETRAYQPPYCLEDECAISEINHPAHAARLGKTPFQKLVNTSPQHDTVQEPTQGYPGPADPPFPLTGSGFEGKDWINEARRTYCLLKGTPNLYFHFAANTQGTHDFINTDSPFENELQNTQELLVNGEGMIRWLHRLVEHPTEAIDRVEEGPTLDRVEPFSCSVVAIGAFGDFDGDGILNVSDICPGTPLNSNVAPNGCPRLAGDTDDDGISDAVDKCPMTATNVAADQFGCGGEQVDSDADGFHNAEDNCPFAVNAGQEDADQDGVGDACDGDVDGDGIANDDDNCPLDANAGQGDADGDGTGDACEGGSNTGTRASAFEDCYQADLTVAPTAAVHRCSWNHHAHGLQRQLDANTPMKESLWLASHNSYNYPQPQQQSTADPNQTIGIAEQLDLEMRAVEIDIHWMEAPRCSGNLQPLVCHGQGDHSTCSGTELDSSVHFNTINDWLADNPGEFVQVDIEANFGVNRTPPCPPGVPEPTGGDPYEVVGDQVAAIFGDKLYSPVDSQSGQLPLEVTRTQMLAAGRQVIVTGPTNNAWGNSVHGLDVRRQHAYDNATYRYPGCEWFTADEYRNFWTRMWEDTTAVGAARVASGMAELEPVRDADLVNMLLCGLNNPSLDKITSSDTRLAAAVWSWKEAEPAVNAEANCALHNVDGRFESADCSGTHAYACTNDGGQNWSVTAASGSFEGGAAACSALGGGFTFAVPETGYLNQRLRDSKAAATVATVWLNYVEDSAIEGKWLPGN